MKWLNEWAKPVFVVSVIGVLANCASQRFDDMDLRFVRMDSRLRVIEQRTFEMNTRLSRIEGHLGIPATVSENENPSIYRKETNSDGNIP
ncbi:MAG: hypothetical protein F4207_10455 [Gemmatimonadetes bacterium]|nr:hypothetical protein [Gemmatimonadota bacterium]MYA76316.1 hypothetical protein [Gemmatimonadota bacterium]MYG16828.1 hypothetical protein [Gemmatimonadota bacterium]MYH18025.1 hypothetical protein [Gemmatimonadota bacterium]